MHDLFSFTRERHSTINVVFIQSNFLTCLLQLSADNYRTLSTVGNIDIYPQYNLQCFSLKYSIVGYAILKSKTIRKIFIQRPNI